MAKIPTNLAEIRDLIAGKEAAAAREQEELAELRRRAAWAEDEQRRARLGAIRAEAEKQIGPDQNEAEEIARLARELAEAARRLHEAGQARNTRIAGLVAQAVAEGVRSHSGKGLPPSPADNGLGVLAEGKGLVVGRWCVRPVDVVRLATNALDAGADAAATGTQIPDFVDTVANLDDQLPPLPDPTTRYYYKAAHGAVFDWDKPALPHQELTPITQLEWLATTWQIDLSELPADVRAEVEAVMPA